MNPIYAIMESPHRWWILAGISITAGCLGAMMMFAYAWPHALALIWLLAGVIASIGLAGQALLDWKRRIDAELESRSIRQS